MSQRLSRLLTLTILLSLFVVCGFSQQKQSKWFYLSTSAEGWKFYYQKEIQKLENGNSASWLKVVYLDESAIEMYDEWDCSQKRYRQLQATVFSSSNEMLADKRNVGWDYVSPDSVSSLSFSIVCKQATETKIVEVIGLQVNLRSFPNKNATVMRTAKKGSRFTLSLAKQYGGWYNVVDEETQQDYWVHGNTVKIIDRELMQK